MNNQKTKEKKKRKEYNIHHVIVSSRDLEKKKQTPKQKTKKNKASFRPYSLFEQNELAS